VDKPYLAIDAGTTVIKAALIAMDGSILDTASCRLAIDMLRDGWCEMDMETVWQTLCQTLRLLRENNAAHWPSIKAVGICGQGDGLWPITQSGHPVRRAILWNDTRAAVLLDYDAVNREALKHASNSLFAGAAPILLRWMKEHEPENYRRTFYVLHCKDWLNYRLTGVVATDETDASTALMDIHSKQYVFSLLDVLDIRESERCYPRVAPSSTIIGEVTSVAEQETGIPKGTPVIAGAIDVLAVAAGCDMLAPGQRGSVIGTTLCNYVVLDSDGMQEHADIRGSVLCHIHPNTYIRLMAALSGASALDWVQREVLNNISYSALETAVADIPVGSDGVLFHPYLFGERAPFRIPTASGAFFGLRAYHTKRHMARAAFEGLVLSLCDCYRNLPAAASDIIVAGGAAKNDLICQMISDCMGTRVTRSRQQELGIAGVARLLQDQFGGDPQHAATQDHFEPDPARCEQYLELYNTFTALQRAMHLFWENRPHTGVVSNPKV
jgi:sugar (pentulose or hexulose) kinase